MIILASTKSPEERDALCGSTYLIVEISLSHEVSDATIDISLRAMSDKRKSRLFLCSFAKGKSIKR